MRRFILAILVLYFMLCLSACVENESHINIRTKNDTGKTESQSLESQTPVNNQSYSEQPKDYFEKNVQVGETITFGSYPQEADGSERPIEWTVLDVKDQKALIISNYLLDLKPYNKEYTDVTWASCTLRRWLNDDFLNTAFSDSEQKKIATTAIHNSNNPTFGTAGGKDTKDKVFLLSLEEVLEYFNLTKNNGEMVKAIYCYGDDCCSKTTEYVIAHGGWSYKWNEHLDSEDKRVYDGNSWWWLRSPGYESNRASIAGTADGAGGIGNRVLSFGEKVDTSVYSVRPALWININP